MHSIICQALSVQEKLRLVLVLEPILQTQKVFLLLDNFPSPSTYSLPSDFQPASKGKVYSFGISRESYCHVKNNSGLFETKPTS